MILNPSGGIQFSQEDSHVQELFQKKLEEIHREIENVAIGIELLPKQPTQFQHMSNEFEIAYWLAHHKKVLDLAINIRNGMLTRTDDEEYETASTSTTSSQHSLVQQVSFQPALTPPEIDQVVKIAYFFVT